MNRRVIKTLSKVLNFLCSLDIEWVNATHDLPITNVIYIDLTDIQMFETIIGHIPKAAIIYEKGLQDRVCDIW